MPSKLHKPEALFAAALATLLTAPATLAVAPAQPTRIYREGEVLVRYRDTASPSAMQSAQARLGLVAKRRLAGARTELLALPSPMATLQALEVLRADPAIEHAEPNFRRLPTTFIPDDPFFSQQWGLRNTGQSSGTAGADLNLTQAWDADDNGTPDRTGIPGVIVAVIDDAILVSHPDLTRNIVSPHNFIACQDPDNPGPVSSNGAHGTLTSGCVGGTGNNGQGVAGIAWNASLMPLKFAFDSATHIEALAWARDHGAKIVNASFGGPGFSQIEEDLIGELAASDILYVAAAGNDDSNTDFAQLSYPANYDADNIVAVAATTRQDAIAAFSQYGPLTIDVAAPGREIVTTAIGNSYATVSGTSFAAPYVAGVAALLKSHVVPSPDWHEIKARLVESGSAVAGANPKQKTSGGRVDADLALDMASRPALVIRAVAYADPAGNNNGLPDAGETLNASFTVRNLWQDASGVTATLAADNGVTVNSSAQSLGAILSQGEAVATFSITLPNVTEHRYVNFTLTLSANAGAYTATRGAGFEIGTLAPGGAITQAFTGDSYDEFHAWHVDVPAQVGIKTLFIRTTTPGGEDVDLLVKRTLPPRYSITVGINPETQAGYFCTSGTAANCDDPDTLVSGRLDGVEAVSVVNPPAGTYHIVVVNFDQQAVAYTVEAVLLDGDLRPDPLVFDEQAGIPSANAATSNSVLVTGIDGPTPITVVGGQYSIDSTAFTSSPGTVGPNQAVRLLAPVSAGARRVQVTIGGVTGQFLVNPTAPPEFDSGDTGCPRTGRNTSSGALPASLLAGLLLAALARRRKRAA